MKNKRCIGLLSVMILFILKAFPQTVSLETAQRVAVNFLSENARVSPDRIRMSGNYMIGEGNAPVYYVFNFDKGFIIVAAIRNVFPVLAWSIESPYYGDHFPPAFARFMKSYQSHIQQAIRSKEPCPQFVIKAWERYSDEIFQPKKNLTGVEPLLITTWSQGCYYNTLFPADTNCPCDHLWTGCVATAMGQVMKYYNYPETGTGSYSYYSSYGLVEADFGNTQYDWISMNYHLDDENDAVAELLFHSAVSINSQFFPNGTGAFDFSAWEALFQYFDYNPQMLFLWRDNFNNDDWLAMLRTELDEGRPVIYGGADSESGSGHTLVCDGYQDSTFFHFNWGWNGTYNGYFYLDSLIAGNNYFDFQHDAIFGIKPDIEVPILAYPPVNLASSVNDHTVVLSWDPPEVPGTNLLLGYNIFRDGLVVNTQIHIQNEFTDTVVPPGDHEYVVKTVYSGAQSGPSESVQVYVSGVEATIVQMLTVYPVPASDYLMIPSNQFASDHIRISIINNEGKEIYCGEKTITHIEPIKINLPEDVSGLLFIKIDAGEKHYSGKIIVLAKL